MKRNVGTADRIIRFIIAALIAIMYFTDLLTGTLGFVLLIVAAVFFLTGIFGRCGLYVPLGLNTCKAKQQKEESITGR